MMHGQKNIKKNYINICHPVLDVSFQRTVIRHDFTKTEKKNTYTHTHTSTLAVCAVG